MPRKLKKVHKANVKRDPFTGCFVRKSDLIDEQLVKEKTTADSSGQFLKNQKVGRNAIKPNCPETDILQAFILENQFNSFDLETINNTEELLVEKKMESDASVDSVHSSRVSRVSRCDNFENKKLEKGADFNFTSEDKK
jgi:hypothetical protein